MENRNGTEAATTPQNIKGLEFSALITDQEIDDLEKIAMDWQPFRRMALAILSKSKEELVQAASADLEVAESMRKTAEEVEEYKLHLNALSEQVDAMQTRLFVALSNHPDVQA